MEYYETFMGIDYSETGKDGRCKSDVAIIGAPFDFGAGNRVGQRFAPRAIRNASVWGGGGPFYVTNTDPQVCINEALRIVDCGDAKWIIGENVQSLQNLHELCSQVVRNTRCLVTLGGDHSITSAPIDALNDSYGPLTIVHFDAHPDTWEPDTVHTHATWIREVVEAGLCKEIFQYGIRGYGPLPHCFDWAKENKVVCNFMESSQHPSPVIESGIESDPEPPVYISVDIDVLDPAFAPGTGVIEPGGMDTRTLLSAIRRIAMSHNVVGFDIVEVIPDYDISEITTIAANRCVMELLAGKAIRETHRR